MYYNDDDDGKHGCWVSILFMENTALGLFPHPKGKRCMFFLAIYYQNFTTRTVRRYFLTEGSRQYTLHGQIEAVEERYAYICGDNPSSLGDLLKGSFLRPGDDARLNFNIILITA